MNRKCSAKYECMKVEWEDLAYRTYTPDFLLPNGIIIETKGRFTPEDRRKHLLIKKQHPDLDIRFVFSTVNLNYGRERRQPMALGAKGMGFCTVIKTCHKNGLTQRKKLLS